MRTVPDPLCLIAELTYRCPLKCPYCSNPLELGRFRQELDTTQWQAVIREAAELGVVQIHFSGGEPLLRQDLATLVATARDAGLYTHLITAGMPLDRARLTTLREAGLDALQISLQDATAEANDRLGGTPSFEKKRQAFHDAKALGFPVTLNIVLHRHNLVRLEAMLELAVAWQADRVELAHTQYTGWAFRNRAALLPSRRQLERAVEIVESAQRRLNQKLQILHVLPDYHQQMPKACLQGWGRVFLTVAPDGATLPCQSARDIPGLVFPNVREHRLQEIWFQSDVFRKFRGVEWMPEPCRGCDRRELDFGGCRCQAFLLTGDAAATDPVCRWAPQHHRVQQLVAQAEEDVSEPLIYRRLE